MIKFTIIKFLYQWLNLFVFLGIVFIPFSFRFFHFQTILSQFLFEDTIVFLADACNLKIANVQITSDATTMYLLFIVLFFISLIMVIFLSFFSFWKENQDKVLKSIQLIMTFYLALILFKYGFDKLFKAQFYLPEPNTLYTPLGMLEKDILFWSTMGVSHSYNIFMGLMEIIPAMLLLYHKTRNIGLLIALGVIVNVVSINFSFDISVKLFSSFLLLIILLLLAKNVKSLLLFLLQYKQTTLTVLSANEFIKSPTIRISVKSILILFIFMESVFPYWQKSNFNDDTIPRNYLHGAYEVIEIKTIHPQVNTPPIKRIFIHRSDYIIFQYVDDSMIDYHLEISQPDQTFTLTNYDSETLTFNFIYNIEKETLHLTSSRLGIEILTKTIDWKSLPLLQPLFHWTVDGIR